MNQLAKNIITLGGDLGKHWLDCLPTLVAACAKKWQLAELTPMPNLSYNYVLMGYRLDDHTKIVLKLGFFKNEIEQEAAALKVYDGNGCVQLLDCDFGMGALLLEQVIPGVSLKTFFPDNDDQAVAHAVSVMKRLHAQPVGSSLNPTRILRQAQDERVSTCARPEPIEPFERQKVLVPDTSIFPTIQNLLFALTKTKTSLIPQKHLDRAQKIAADLLQTQSPVVLLHGDLHHDNILSSTREGWLAIDPKGVMGEPAYEIGAFIRNPTPALLTSKIIARRLELFADLLQMDKRRLRDWSYVQAVLSACWSLQDGNGLEPMIPCAELIEHIKFC